MTGTYPEKFTHNELIELGRAWCIKPYSACADYGHSGCAVVITEIKANTYAMEEPDVLGFCNKGSILIECKASRADFLKDKEKVFRHPALKEMALGNQRWYLAPLGIIKPDEVPEDWGLLEVLRNRDILYPKIRAAIQESNKESEINILISVMRRLNAEKDGHIAIMRYVEDLKGFGGPSKKKATFYINDEETSNA